MIRTLGLSAYYHDSAAALAVDHEIVAAAQEERFTRVKHDASFPALAINACLEEAYLEPDELDAIVYYDSPVLSWQRIVANAMEAGGEQLFVEAAHEVLGRKLWVQDEVQRSLGSLGRAGRLLFCEHHLAHAASAFYPSPFEEAAIVTIDGVGEWTTTSIGHGCAERIELSHEITYPHSLGLLYTAVTTFCGFKANSGEYKLMGLAPYGEPRYADLIREHLIDIRPDGSYRLQLEHFGYLDGPSMTTESFAALFGGPAREPESRISQREVDLAASVQVVTEEVVDRITATAQRESGSRNLVLAGGVALNCVANGRLAASGAFDGIWVQPAAGDAGGALGAALLAAHAYFGVPRPSPAGRDRQRGSLLGPAYSPSEVGAFLDRRGLPSTHLPDPDERAKRVAALLADGAVVGHFSGRMEFGPRALGNRSILADARSPDTQRVMNLKIKYSESFRPFAPIVLAEDCADYFEFDGESPYMLMVAPVRRERRTDGGGGGSVDDLLAIVNQVRSDIPAVTHVDHSARLQTVDA
ncbi:MAG: carbamoyltransferase, partial [Acidimicrobiia bacterium]